MSPSLKHIQPAAIPDLVRLGRDHDGGYVVAARSIDRATTLLSLGVNDDVSFETHAQARNPKLSCLCFDPTVSFGTLLWRSAKLLAVSGACLVALQMGPARRKFNFARRVYEFKRFFGGERNTLVRKWVSREDAANSISLQTMFEKLVPRTGKRDVFVKMDIEGAEYECLADLLPHLHRLTGLAIEFHNLDRHAQDVIDLIARFRSEMHVAHVHGNNFHGLVEGTDLPVALELTLVPKEYYGALPPSTREYPVAGLDMPNHHRYPDMRLAF